MTNSNLIKTLRQISTNLKKTASVVDAPKRLDKMATTVTSSAKSFIINVKEVLS